MLSKGVSAKIIVAHFFLFTSPMHHLGYSLLINYFAWYKKRKEELELCLTELILGLEG